ncbi:MAG: tetratricopeptide repeat protein [Myxococcota bacterium]
MKFYSFSKLPPGMLLVQLLEQKFNGILTIIREDAKLQIFFNQGIPVKCENSGIECPKPDLEHQLLNLFTMENDNFTLQPQPDEFQGDEINPLPLINQGIKKCYTEQRLLKETSKLLKGKLFLSPKLDDYIEHFNFDENQMLIIDLLRKEPLSAKELAKKTNFKVIDVLKTIYVLGSSKLLKNQNNKSSATSQNLTVPSQGKSKLDQVLEKHDIPEKNREIAKELFHNIELISKDNPFARLDLQTDASDADIKKAFSKKVKKFHPDRITSKEGLAFLREEVDSYFQKLTETYNLLQDKEEREKFINPEKATKNTKKVKKVLKAEVEFQKGMVYFKKKDYEEAEKHFKKALRLQPDEGIYMGMWAWVTYINPENDKENIRHSILEALKEACKKSEKEADLQYYLGKIMLDSGQFASAKNRFQNALRIKRNHIEAARELRLMNKRKKNQKQSLLSKFNIFKKN